MITVDVLGTAEQVAEFTFLTVLTGWTTPGSHTEAWWRSNGTQRRATTPHSQRPAAIHAHGRPLTVAQPGAEVVPDLVEVRW
jgi:hypothetical protein